MRKCFLFFHECCLKCVSVRLDSDQHRGVSPQMIYRKLSALIKIPISCFIILTRAETNSQFNC